MNGALKWAIPYGNQARMSNVVLFVVAKTLDKLSPYKMVSKAGKTFTEMAGFQESGILPHEKKSANQAKIGKAWTKNCEVTGMRKHSTNGNNILDFIRKDAGNIM